MAGADTHTCSLLQTSHATWHSAAAAPSPQPHPPPTLLTLRLPVHTDVPVSSLCPLEAYMACTLAVPRLPDKIRCLLHMQHFRSVGGTWEVVASAGGPTWPAPWPCPRCRMQPFTSVSTLLGHGNRPQQR